MGVDLRGLETLVRLSNQEGFEGKSILTLGRQSINVKPRHLIISKFKSMLTLGRESINLRPRGLAISNFNWLDEFLVACGAAQARSLDVSGYEGASDVADLQDPPPAHLIDWANLILDFGTSEHVFDIQAVYRSVFSILRFNGLYVGILPRSGWGDHGLYQFNPEFAHVLKNKYDWDLELFSTAVDAPSAVWRRYENFGADPPFVRKAIKHRSYLVMFLRKTGESPADQTSPSQQSIRYTEAFHIGNAPRVAMVSTFGLGQYLSLPLPPKRERA